ncbi:Isochorismatase hydrolase [Peniophora sp. CONT]|nr:Isochorismatase hydrolase [Peniophora sp. CONT]
MFMGVPTMGGQASSESTAPIHDTPILGFKTRPHVQSAQEWGNPSNFWVEYPSGLVDLTRTTHLPADANEPELKSGQFDLPVDGDRVIRLDPAKTAYVIVDMQNFFLHPDLRAHPKGLACVDPLLTSVPALRSQGVTPLWVNWGLTPSELQTLPPSLLRGFSRPDTSRSGFGGTMPGDWGKLLMRGEKNSELYGPLQVLYEEGAKEGKDQWVHKNRMSGIWGGQSALDLVLKEMGITTLLVAGVNADQCVLGTMIDAYYLGYDIVLVSDATATTSPEGGMENVVYNAGGSYGFVTDSERIVAAAKA